MIDVGTDATLMASAPGKLVLCGEYAVLAGHEAVVAAVDVRATATRTAGPLAFDERSPLLAACIEELRARGEEPEGRIVVDTAAFLDPAGRKLGLGSSAAAAAAFLGALLPNASVDVVHDITQAAHRRFQGGKGSGIDVAASCLGGIVRFLRAPGGPRARAAPPIPEDLSVVVAWSGSSQDTRHFIGRVQAAPHWREAVGPLGAAAALFLDACGRQAADDVLRAVEAARRGMAELGELAGIDIVSAPHRRIAALAAQHGGAAKPSGAGGGDVAICLVPRKQQAALEEDLRAEQLPPIPLHLAAPGLWVEVFGWRPLTNGRDQTRQK